MPLVVSSSQLEPGDNAYRILAEKNSFDIQLYEVVLQLFEEQRAVVEAYAQSASSTPAQEEEEPPAPDEDAPATAEARERRRNLAQGASKKVVLAEAREQHRLLVKDKSNFSRLRQAWMEDSEMRNKYQL